MAGTLSIVKELRFLYPLDGALFMYDAGAAEETQMLRIDAGGGEGESAELFDNGKSLGVTGRPFSWLTHLSPGTHTLLVKTMTATASITIDVR